MPTRPKTGLLLFFSGGAAPDTTRPTCTITCAQSSPSTAATLNFTITFSESVTGFEVGDFAITNGTKGALGGSGAVYTCDVTPTGMSVVTANVAEGVAEDAAANTNTAADQLSITSTAPFSDAFTRSDGAIAGQWTGGTWTIARNAALNTPTQGSELIINGGFDADTNWTKDAGWTISGGVANATDSSFASLSQNVLTSPRWYYTACDVVRTSGTVKSRLGAVLVGTLAATGSLAGTGRTDGAACALQQQSTFTGTIDNVTAKQLTLASLFATLPTSVADVVAQVVITVSPDKVQAGHVLNLDSISSPLNFVLAYLDGQGVARLDKCVSGTYTSVISGVVTFGATKNLMVTKSGDNYSLYYGAPGSETQVGTTQAIASMNGTIHGLFSTHSSIKFDTYQLSTNP
jgi:hypothetical protein